jgi:hypothetical protein
MVLEIPAERIGVGAVGAPSGVDDMAALLQLVKASAEPEGDEGELASGRRSLHEPVDDAGAVGLAVAGRGGRLGRRVHTVLF